VMILILLSTMIGALIGTSCGVLVMHRRIRLPITEADLTVLKSRLQSAESSLAATTASVEIMRGEITERDRMSQQHSDDLRKARVQLELAAAEAEKEAAQRSAAEQRAEELLLQAADLAEQRAALEAQVQEERKLAAEKATQERAAFETQLDASQGQIQELKEQLARFAAESAEVRLFGEEESRRAAALDAKLRAGEERIRQLTDEILELQGERSRWESKLQEERQSAAKGMELLLMAQESLSRVFNPNGVEAGNGKNGHDPFEPQSEVAQELQAAASE